MKTYKCLICGKLIRSDSIVEMNKHLSFSHREYFYEDNTSYSRKHDVRLRDYVDIIVDTKGLK